ncbi:MAG TPA: N-acetylneuraminate synthase [Chitinophagaceae bacterium]
MEKADPAMGKVIIIAEAGVNHNGKLSIAKKLIDVAAKAGADFVKFQSFKAKRLAGKSAGQAAYQEKNTGKKESQLQMLGRLELSDKDHRKLLAHCEKRKIAFLSTPFDQESIRLLVSLGVSLGKIPSGEITNLPYLRQMAASFPQIVLSTGMSTMQEVRDALQVLESAGRANDDITVLHCTTEYPTPMTEVNLRAMVTMREQLGVKTGYSDHTKGIEVATAAVALGATLIEKHFTLDRKMEGPDHKASLEPRELKEMITAIRNIEKAMGNGEKKPVPSELANIAVARKSLMAARDLPAGHRLTAVDIAIKRPGTGITPMRLPDVIGKTLARAVNEDELFSPKDFAS